MMRVAAVQTHPVFGDPDANLARIEDMLAAVDADVIVLPELATSGYLFTSEEEARALGESVDGPRIDRLIDCARLHDAAIVAGFPERAGDGALYNSAAVCTADGVLAVYRKIHLFADETRWFARGDAPPPVVRWREAALGVMICFDWRFPETARSLALRGAQVICHPSNLVMTQCPDAMITRSIENRVFSITANRVGTEDRGGRALTYTGRSQITSPQGERLASADATSEVVLVAEIDPHRADDKRVTPQNDVFADRRPALYDGLTE